MFTHTLADTNGYCSPQRNRKEIKNMARAVIIAHSPKQSSLLFGWSLEVVEVGRGKTTNFLRLLFVHFSSYWLRLLFRWLLLWLPLLRIRQFIQQTMLTHLLHAYIKTEQMKRKNNSHGVQQKPSLNTYEWLERRLTCVCVCVRSPFFILFTPFLCSPLECHIIGICVSWIWTGFHGSPLSLSIQ